MSGDQMDYYELFSAKAEELLAIMMNVFFYLMYRLVRKVYMWALNRFSWKKHGIEDVIQQMKEHNEASYQTSCQIMSIEWQGKALDIDPARDVDFVPWHESFVSPTKILKEKRWTIYCITWEWVYFVYTRKTLRDFDAKRCAYMSMSQFHNATRLARMPHWAFVKMCKRLEPPKCKMVYVSNVAQSGTTLLCQALQTHESITALAEPDAISSLTVLKAKELVSEDMLLDLLRSSLYYLGSSMRPEEILILKPRGVDSFLLPELYKVMPEMSHIFVYRRNIEKSMISMLKMFMVLGSRSIWKLMIWFPSMVGQILGFLEVLAPFIQKYPIRSTTDAAFFMYALPHRDVLHAQIHDGIEFHRIAYEDMVTFTETTLRQTFDWCGVDSKDCIQRTLAAFKRDSMEGTELNAKALANAEVEMKRLSVKDKTRCNKMCDVMGIPKFFE